MDERGKSRISFIPFFLNIFLADKKNQKIGKSELRGVELAVFSAFSHGQATSVRRLVCPSAFSHR